MNTGQDDGRFERQHDWSRCAYFYLDRPENNLPALAPVADQIASFGRSRAWRRSEGLGVRR